MSFLVAAALAIGLLVGAPLAAHLLRRGKPKEQIFPAARLVPQAQPVARQRSTLEDRWLFAIRALMVLGLALLGATPFVSCSRLSVTRTAGASVALAIVLDDSASMRASYEGRERWERALDGARELLDSTREGDAVAIVLAGQPARLELAATTDLGAARKALDDLDVSDRPTDLHGATQIARSALKQLPHKDKRVVLLSDLAGSAIPEGTPQAWAPLEALRQPVANCGVISATRQGSRVRVEIGCSDAAAAKGRKLQLQGQAKVSAPLVERAGAQTVVLDLPEPKTADAGSDVAAATPSKLDVRLDGKDALAHDDVAPVAPQAKSLSIAVLADPSRSSVITGGATVVEQALDALETGAAVRPLSVLPTRADGLAAYSALIIDDPPGLGVDVRAAILSWVEQGGTALALLGPGSAKAQLGSTLEPFLAGKVRWEATSEKGIAAASLPWLGKEALGLADIQPTGRARLDGMVPKNASIVARWQDGQPWLLEDERGRGLLLTAGLPSAVEISDFCLRPAFLALLDHVVSEAQRRSGPRSSLAGVTWTFPRGSPVTIQGPSKQQLSVEESVVGDGRRQPTTVPTERGRYEVQVEGQTRERFVTLAADELTRPPRSAEEVKAALRAGTGESQVDASPRIALALLGLLLLELLLRLGVSVRDRLHTRRLAPR